MSVLLALRLLIVAQLEEVFSLDTTLFCGSNFSVPVIVEPPIYESTPLLIDWGLLSPDNLCSEPARRPTFNHFPFHDVSLISVCMECPTCSVVLPESYELPLSLSLHTLFLVTRHLPYNKQRSDIDVRFVLAPTLPTIIKNCQLIVRGRPPHGSPMGQEPFDWSNVLLISVVVFSITLMVCAMRCICDRIVASKEARHTQQQSAVQLRHKLSTISCRSSNQTPSMYNLPPSLDHALLSAAAADRHCSAYLHEPSFEVNV